MADQLSPGSGGPLVDPDGHVWRMTKRRLDLRMVRRAIRKPDELLLLGESGGFERRWVKPDERVALWDQVQKRYAGPGGTPSGDYTGHQFADSDGRQLTYLELHC